MEKMRLPKIDIGDDIASLQKKAIEDLRNDEEVYRVIHDDLHLSNSQVKESLATLLDYQDDVHYCANCPGYDLCAKTNPHFEMGLELDEGYLKRNYSPCRVVRKFEELEKRFFVRDFPVEWRDKDFRSIDKTAQRKQAIIEMMKICRTNSGDWVYLTGKNGSGKSYILAMFANTYSALHPGCAFCDTSALVDKLKDLQINSKNEFDERFKALCSCPLLVLDDFGNEFKTDFVFSSILFPILNARAKANLPTAFSSDFSLIEIESMYRLKVGAARARQLKDLILARCKVEFDVTGLPVY